jgi:hypothetical protein
MVVIPQLPTILCAHGTLTISDHSSHLARILRNNSILEQAVLVREITHILSYNILPERVIEGSSKSIEGRGFEDRDAIEVVSFSRE